MVGIFVMSAIAQKKLLSKVTFTGPASGSCRIGRSFCIQFLQQIEWLKYVKRNY